jgi:hypothetical protein
VGHSSFSDLGRVEVESRGTGCSPGSQTPHIDAAVEKFERLIRDLAKRHDLFDGVSEIYLDSCIELRSLPRLVCSRM